MNVYINLTDSRFSEIETFAQYQFAGNDTHAASIMLPAGRPAAFHQDARDDHSSGAADVELAALYGRDMRLGPVKVFAAAEAGYRCTLANPPM